MRYVSTRGHAPELSFKEAALTGLASDGGLYVPKNIPVQDNAFFERLRHASFEETAFEVIRLFTGNEIPDEDLKEMIQASYAGFSHDGVCPLKQMGSNRWMMELFHGPTFAFKDVALQFLGHVLDYFLKQDNRHVTIIGATSGDTGSAAIEGCRHSNHVNICILHPHKRVSDVQRRQMTTVKARNVRNIAIDGGFDDCQDIVKYVLQHQPLAESHDIRFAAVNSINWCRILAQITYYIYASVRLGCSDKRVAFSVPTGNFGDIYAGYVAKRMGAPIGKLIIATNNNDILHRFISANDYGVRGLERTLSPSMDISIASNFERFLFDLHDHDAHLVRDMMTRFRREGLSVSAERLNEAKRIFASAKCSDEDTIKTMRYTADRTGEYVDPHTATGLYAAEVCAEQCENQQIVVLATAHRSKFPEAASEAGFPDHLETPKKLQDVMSMEEFYEILPADRDAVLKGFR